MIYIIFTYIIIGHDIIIGIFLNIYYLSFYIKIYTFNIILYTFNNILYDNRKR
jgi:hypothetical protein